jgi:hypothetical protein
LFLVFFCTFSLNLNRQSHSEPRQVFVCLFRKSTIFFSPFIRLHFLNGSMDLSILDEDGDIIPASAREPLFNNSVEINTLPWLFDDNLPRPEVTQGLVSPSLSPTLVAAASTRAETVVDTNFSLSLLPVPKDGLVSLDGLAALDIRDGHPAR